MTGLPPLQGFSKSPYNTDKARNFSNMLKHFQKEHHLTISDLAFGLRVKNEDLCKWMGTDKKVPVEPPASEYDRIRKVLEIAQTRIRSSFPREKPEPKVWLDFVEIPIVTGNGVTLIPYLMSTTPITNEAYGVFLEATNHRKPSYWDRSAYNRPKQPVVGVSWDDAMAFCDWAGVSLPTEAQWEYACRAGSTTKYYFGDDPKQLDEYAWYYGNSKGNLQDVAQKKPNAWGLYDMHGNVWEWTADHCDVNGQVLHKVRGAGCENSAEHCRSSSRSGCEPSYWGDSLGFRVIKGGSWCGDRCRSEDRDSLDPSKRNNGLSFRVIKGGSWNYSAEFSWSSFHRCYGPEFRGGILGFRVAQQIDQRISYIACHSVDPQQPQ